MDKLYGSSLYIVLFFLPYNFMVCKEQFMNSPNTGLLEISVEINSSLIASRNILG